MDIQNATQNLLDATMAFYGDCLTTYPELLNDPQLNAIEAAMKRPVPPDADDNPAYRLVVYLSEYKGCSSLLSYEQVYEAFEALTAVARSER